MAFGRKRPPAEEPFIPTDDSQDEPQPTPKVVKKKASEIALEKSTAAMNESFAKLMERINDINTGLSAQTKVLMDLVEKDKNVHDKVDEPPADEPPADEPTK